VTLDKYKPVDYQAPLYLQVYDSIVKKIRDKEYLPGQKLPSERDMAKLYGISRMTVKAAYNKMEENGIVVSELGRGTFVATPESIILKTNFGPDNTIQNRGFGTFVKGKGIRNSSKVIGKGCIKAGNYVGYKLGIDLSDEVFFLFRVRMADGEPINIEYCYLPYEFFPDVDTNDYKRTSLYAYMKSKGQDPITFKQNMILIKCSMPQAKLLSIEVNDPLYLFEYVGYDQKGKIVEFTRSFIRCDRVIFNYHAHT